MSEVEYCYIAYDLFDDITAKSPVLRQQIINQFLDELELVEKKAIHLAHKTVREKIAEALLQLAEAYQYEEKKQSFRIRPDQMRSQEVQLPQYYQAASRYRLSSTARRRKVIPHSRLPFPLSRYCVRSSVPIPTKDL